MKNIKEKIKFLGCKVNQVEADDIGKILFKYNLYDFGIINTCTLTKKADSKSRYLINKFINSSLETNFLIITGCMVERLFDSLYQELIEKKHLKKIILVKNQDKEKIEIFLEKIFKLKSLLGDDYKQKLENIIEEKKYINNIIEELEKFISSQKFNLSDINKNLYRNKTRNFLKIQDGCNSFCSYCIVPFVRNKIFSLSFDKIKEEIKNAIDLEYKEIVLTGIRIGLYNNFYGGKTVKLEDVIKYISSFKEIPRIRISSIEPTEITDELLGVFSENLLKNNNLCEHFHIPIQSGDDEVLHNMNRKYDTEYLHNLFVKIRKLIPDVRITIDLIVGYLGETEKNFERTLRFLEENKIDGIHIFPFSVREGTFAEKILKENKKLLILPEIMENREKILFDLNEKLTRLSLEKFMNKNLEILLEDSIKKENYYSGYTKNYIKGLVSKNLVKKLPKNGLMFMANLKNIDMNDKRQFFFRVE